MQIYVPHTHTQTHTHLERLLFSMSFRTSDSKYFKPSSLNRKRLWMVSSMMPNTCFCASSNMSGGGRKHSNEAQDTPDTWHSLQSVPAHMATAPDTWHSLQSVPAHMATALDTWHSLQSVLAHMATAPDTWHSLQSVLAHMATAQEGFG